MPDQAADGGAGTPRSREQRRSRQQRLRFVAAVLLLAWSAALWWLLISREVTGLRVARWSYVNNLAHAGLFGMEALLIGTVLAPGAVGRPRGTWFAAALVALGYAGVLEWLQGFTEGRSSDWRDMVTNAVGVFGAPWALERWPLAWGRIAVVALASAAAAALATFG